MGMFVVFALAQSFVPSMEWLVAVRFILGIPLGSDISSGYTYIMESMPRGEREVMGCYESDGASLEEAADQGLRADQAVG